MLNKRETTDIMTDPTEELNKLSCTKCNKKYSSAYALRRHNETIWHQRGGKKTRAERKIHVCDLCNYKGITPFDLRAHEKTNKHNMKLLIIKLEWLTEITRLRKERKRKRPNYRK